MADQWLGGKVRALRRREGLTQQQLAARVGISASYLNLIEHNRRAVTAPLLIKLAQVFELDLRSLSGEDDERVVASLMTALNDPVLERHDVSSVDVKEVAATHPAVARAMLSLYEAYHNTHEAVQALAARLSDVDEGSAADLSRLPSEEVTDLIQRHMNYFPDLEDGAAALWRDAGLDAADLYPALARYLRDTLDVDVRIETLSAMRGAIRRYDPATRVLALSEVLRRGNRNFQLAYQIGLMTARDVLDRIAADPMLTSEESRALARVALANYFAAAVLMPYDTFLEAARAERYDIELLAHRFRCRFEQVCQRVTTLRRPGAEGIPMHFVRIDVAGNISKRFSASGLRFARFAGACPRWVVFSAFLTPDLIRTQIAQMPDGSTYFWIARTIKKESGGYHRPDTIQAIGIGCDIRDAAGLVYSDGMNLQDRKAAVPVGPTCRLCERMDCAQRAFPAVQHPLQVHEYVRGISFYAPVDRPGEET